MDSRDSPAANAAPVPKGRYFAEDTIEIAAPVERVRAALLDFAGWSAWNPLYPETAGTMALDETLHFAVKLDGMKPRTGAARVITLDPAGCLIQYQVNAMGGLARATRYIEIAETQPGRVRVTNGEIMGGFVGRLIFKVAGETVRRGLAGMNNALRQKLEQAG